MSRPLGAQRWEHGSQRVEHAEDVYVEDGTRGRVSGFLDGRDEAETRVVDEDIDPAEVGNGRVDGFTDLPLVGHIGFRSQQRPRRAERAPNGLRIACGSRDAMTASQSFSNDRGAQPTRGPGDKPHSHYVSLFSCICVRKNSRTSRTKSSG